MAGSNVVLNFPEINWRTAESRHERSILRLSRQQREAADTAVGFTNINLL